MEMAAAGFLVLFLFVFLRVPVAIAMISIGIAGFATVNGWGPALISSSQALLDASRQYSLTVIPLFLLMGNIIARAGFAEDLYAGCEAWIGHHRGGLARATILSCAAFSAVCGSSLATTATMSRVALPPMQRLGYAPSLAAGSIAAGGTLGILIPPSIIMVLYGIMTNTDISKLFIAGILPGLLGVLLYVLTIAILTRLRPGIGPPSVRVGWTLRWRSIGAVWEMVLLFVLVIGGIYAGAFTPTEAAGVGAGGALAAAIARRRISLRSIGEALYETARMTAGIFLILVGALVFSNFLNMTPLPKALGGWALDFGTAPIFIILSISVIYLILGCILDSISMILLTVPLFFPVVKEAGIDPIWFGVLVVVVTEISLITPPIGMNIFVLNATATDVPISTIYRGVTPFVLADVCRLALMIAFPAIATVLPSLM